MSNYVDIRIPASQVTNDEFIRKSIQDEMPSFSKAQHFRIAKRSIDARQKKIHFNLRIECYERNEEEKTSIELKNFSFVKGEKRVLIIGAGPAGLFSALRLIELGIQPIIIERGKDVQARRRDLVAIHRDHKVDPNSNYCFGEGGAGTYSDGKLYTRSTKRGDVTRILETLVQFGADKDILVDAHPHIGTNKLPGIIKTIREKIIVCGGEVHFEKQVIDLVITGDRCAGVLTSNGEKFEGDACVLATGHSARDIFQLLHSKKIHIEFKPFALGVRVEHPQSFVDHAQYHCDSRPDYLPAAAYKLVHQTADRGVYTFCMCPGGIIAPCATHQEEVVTNGWSPSKRNNPWANSGIVVPVEWTDLAEFHCHGPLAGLAFQESVENKCWKAAGSTQAVPAQRLADFVRGKLSETLPQCSYQPGTKSARLDLILPSFISKALKEGFISFNQKMKGFINEEAIIVGPESRTSSPVRIPRNPETLEHVDISDLYPCAEGAGYAGGIVSAAIDGEKVALSIYEKLNKKR